MKRFGYVKSVEIVTSMNSTPGFKSWENRGILNWFPQMILLPMIIFVILLSFINNYIKVVPKKY